MKGENRVLLFLVCAGMELSYLYACTTFATTAIFHRSFPFPEAVGSFLAAALLTLLAEGRGWRIIYVVGVESVGFAPAAYRMIEVFRSWSDSFSTQSWLAGYFTSPTDAVQYFIFILLIVWALVFWAGGVGLAGRQRDYSTLCSRFDRGLIAFFVVFLTKFYLQALQGIRVEESASGFFIIPFLMFSLLAIGLVRNESALHRDYIPGFQAIGVLIGFVVVVLLAGTGLVFFFLPYLTLAAEKGNDVLNLVSGPLVSVFFAILTFIFGTDFAAKNAPVETTPIQGSTAPFIFPAWLEFVGKILAVGVGILVAFVFLAIVGGLLYGMLQGLVSRTSVDPEKPSAWDLLSWLTKPLRALWLFFRRALFRNVRGYREAVRLYTSLRIWGSRSGSPHNAAETPAEYGLRLQRLFPMLSREIGLIVDGFNRVAYGDIVLDEQQMLAARSAWCRLASPSRWPMRLKAWLHRFSRLSEAS